MWLALIAFVLGFACGAWWMARGIEIPAHEHDDDAA